MNLRHFQNKRLIYKIIMYNFKKRALPPLKITKFILAKNAILRRETVNYNTNR